MFSSQRTTYHCSVLWHLHHIQKRNIPFWHRHEYVFPSAPLAETCALWVLSLRTRSVLTLLSLNKNHMARFQKPVCDIFGFKRVVDSVDSLKLFLQELLLTPPLSTRHLFRLPQAYNPDGVYSPKMDGSPTNPDY